MKRLCSAILFFFGFSLIPAILLAGPVTSIMKSGVKITSKYGDDFARLVRQYGDDAGNLISKYGDDAVKIVDKHGDDGIKVLQRYGDDAIGVFGKHGDDGVKALSKYGDDALTLFKKSDESAFLALLNHGDDAMKAASKYGDDGLKLLAKNSDTCQKLILMNAPARTVTVLTRFSKSGLQRTGALLKRIQNAPPSDIEKLFEFIEKFGEVGTEFIWKNLERMVTLAGKEKAGFLISALVVYGFTHPEQVQTGMKLTSENAKHFVTVAGEVAKTVASDGINAGRKTIEDSYILQFAIAAVIFILGIALILKFNLLCDFFSQRPGASHQQDTAPKPSFIDPPVSSSTSNETKNPPWV